ncbi:hypothetical protein OFO42_24475 [Escherichia coli]|nr:hypothetical protein [Escherichia coli]
MCSPMTSLKTSIKTITYLSDIGCLEIHGASLKTIGNVSQSVWLLLTTLTPKNPPFIMVQV